MKALYYLTIGIYSIILLQSCSSCNDGKQKVDEITLADASVVWWMAPGIIAQTDSIYEKNNLKVNSFDVQTGLASKNAVISGSADIGLVASTPLAMGAFNHDDLIILCSYVESKELISLVTRKTNDTSKFSKPKTPVAVVKGTISELYLYNYLKNYFPNEVKEIMKNQLNVKPADIPNTLKKGSNANSASIWEPFATFLANDSTLKINRSPDIYTHRIYIVTTAKVLKDKRVAVEKFVKSIEMACQNMNSNKLRAQSTIKSKFPKQVKSMTSLWDEVTFDVKYDFGNMKELIFKDAQSSCELELTPKDNNGKCKKLNANDLDYYFDHNFKKEITNANKN